MMKYLAPLEGCEAAYSIRASLMPTGAFDGYGRTPYNLRPRAVSSAVEHCFHTAGVAGSVPAPPTNKRSRVFHLMPDSPVKLGSPAFLWAGAARGPPGRAGGGGGGRGGGG